LHTFERFNGFARSYTEMALRRCDVSVGGGPCGPAALPGLSALFFLDEGGDTSDAFDCPRIVHDLIASLPEQLGISGVTDALGGCGTPVGASWNSIAPNKMTASAP